MARWCWPAFLAWIGLGADGLSSANYGPEEAFVALGVHSHLALYIAVATAITVFLIAMAYNQVIELFPSGGGGYKVATVLIGPYAGLVGGAALIVDYVLTIAISIASGADAVFSLMPLAYQRGKLPVEIVMTIILLVLNLRGVKEPLRILIPIFIGFVLSHAALIIYGIATHASFIPELAPNTFAETRSLADQIGWFAVISLLLRAYSLGGGTYTGIEAVSNNVNILKEPRVQTGRLTMLYMALSLSFMAGGLLLLYLLWGTQPQPGQTLNAVVFAQILHNIAPNAEHFRQVALTIVLVFAASILFVAANTGFLGGPAVLANMAADRWVPHQFSNLSNRLVTQNGIILMGAAAIATLAVTKGKVSVLVVLYSINVFITFTLCLLGLCIYWIRRHDPTQPRFSRLGARRDRVRRRGRHPGRHDRREIHRGRLADLDGDQLRDRARRGDPAPLRLHGARARQGRRVVRDRHAERQAERRNRLRSDPADRRVHGRKVARHRHAHAAVAAPPVPEPVPEFRVRQRRRNRLRELPRRGDAQSPAQGGRRHAQSLYRLLPAARLAGDRLPGLRARRGGRAHPAGRRGDRALSQQRVLRLEADLRPRELVRPPAA
ncbi:MAG: APC family permease [Pseudomonadota bacterium]